ncbi:MAG: phosphohydrolase [Comamonadaceae bacterium CG_4_9_14_0_8_um_filter_57_21]|nr:MAG: phosphohydrolase [Comamonadaceae bacterium CG_4_9_14_0_8_um_filter_57_21]
MTGFNTTPLLSPKFALALQFANEIHGTQTRKGRGAPYVSHLMAVCSLVLEFGGTEAQAIAALLHDSAEDCGGKPMLETVRVMFGDDVAEIVSACTDTFISPKPQWQPRKEAYLAALRQKSASIKLVACADKLHNLSNTLRDIGAEGFDQWRDGMDKSPNGSADKQLWYYAGCCAALSDGWENPLLDEFSRAVAQFEALARGQA